jgi:hypothetical protein
LCQKGRIYGSHLYSYIDLFNCFFFSCLVVLRWRFFCIHTFQGTVLRNIIYFLRSSYLVLYFFVAAYVFIFLFFPVYLIINKNLFCVLLWKCLLIWLNAASVLKLGSQWLEISRQLVVISFNDFWQLLEAKRTNSESRWMWKAYTRSFQKPFHMVTSGCQKPFYNRISAFQDSRNN